ncbi:MULTISPECIES: HlyD family secretion protein [Inquilinus]|uniref:Membrane fusion protein (Multidrug efflux system) n=1 Tax=Inquilinus ginsengisoli TaxID=363840 RepID=A0ABU1JZC7_9PROT|nr:HlyD family secretion protein [Inquilinus ginsengisoli]MDR6293678.1 membrane fusion protein (multidrug efflux system) [Inquilinus ginsengisoli]
MRKPIIVVAALIAAAGAGYFGYHWWTVGRFLETTDNAYVQSDTATLSPQVEGSVVEVLVTDNQMVKAGAPLIRIDDRDYRAQVAQAKAELAGQQATLASIEQQLALQGSMIAQATATVDQATATLAQSGNDLERARRLWESRNGSQQAFETADTDQKRATAALASAQAALANQQGQTAILEASRRQAQAQIEKLTAAVDLAQISLDRTVIHAPVDGVVGNKGVEVGQYVKAGTQLLSIVPLPKVYVVANFKETQLSDMRVGQSVALSIDAFPGKSLTGHVESFAPASGAEFSLLPPENATGNFTKVVQRVPVRIALPIDNQLSGLLRPGLSVGVSVDTREEGTGPLLASGIFGAAVAAELRQ